MVAQRPNIIVLILDAVRAKNLSAYGYPVQTTPNLDAFAEESILFRRAFAPATWTIPTHASMLSGLYLSQHRIESVAADHCFHDAIVTLPQALRSVGYRTAAFSSNDLFSPRHHFEAGIDEFHELDELMKARTLTKLIQELAEHPSGFARRPLRYIKKAITPRCLLTAVNNWFTKSVSQTQPLFAVINLANAHYPWAVPLDLLWKNFRFHPKYLLQQDYVSLAPFAFNSGRRQVTTLHRRIWQYLYNAALMHVDREVGRFLRHVRQQSNTIVVITADHGEMLGDYRGIVGHTLSLHDNIIHVPLIVHHPDYPAGLKVEGVVQNMDLYASALEWAAVPTTSIPSIQLQRPSLTHAIAKPTDDGGYAFAEEDYTERYDLLGGLRSANPAMDPNKYPRRQVAIRSAHHKYVWINDRTSEFYNVTTDPEEMNNLIDSSSRLQSSELTKLQDALDSWQKTLQTFTPKIVTTQTTRDTAMTERLRALGYLA